jgi:hypothetical protein
VLLTGVRPRAPTAVATCECFAGFEGASCDQPVALFCVNQCSGRGRCTPAGFCHCRRGYWGIACEVSASGWRVSTSTALPLQS